MEDKNLILVSKSTEFINAVSLKCGLSTPFITLENADKLSSMIFSGKDKLTIIDLNSVDFSKDDADKIFEGKAYNSELVKLTLGVKSQKFGSGFNIVQIRSSNRVPFCANVNEEKERVAIESIARLFEQGWIAPSHKLDDKSSYNKEITENLPVVLDMMTKYIKEDLTSVTSRLEKLSDSIENERLLKIISDLHKMKTNLCGVHAFLEELSENTNENSESIEHPNRRRAS